MGSREAAWGVGSCRSQVRLEERGQCRLVFTTVDVSVHGSKVRHVWSLEGAQVVVGEWFQRDFGVGWLDGDLLSIELTDGRAWKGCRGVEARGHARKQAGVGDDRSWPVGCQLDTDVDVPGAEATSNVVRVSWLAVGTLVQVVDWTDEGDEAWCSSPRRWVQPGEGDARTDDRGCRLASQLSGRAGDCLR